MAARRKLYVDYLHQHEHNSQMSTDDEMKMLEWTKTKMISSDSIY